VKHRVSILLAQWYAQGHRDLPWRRTTDPYRIWVSEIMLQQTRAAAVIPYYRRFLDRFPTIEALTGATEPEVLALWSGLGYYSRARNLLGAARRIAARGAFPRQYDELRQLVGVGDYTAAAVASIAFGEPRAVLDGNVLRVVARVENDAGDVGKPKTRERFRAVAESWLDRRQPGAFNQALMELGALICLPRRPKCALCPACRECFARRENRVGDFPAPARRTPARRRRFIAFIARRRGRIFVRRRPGGGVNAGLWEFPNIEIPVKTRNLASKAAPFSIGRGGPFFRVRHTITRSRILLEAFRANLPVSQEPPGAWKSMAEARQLAFTSAHRKVLEALCRLQTRKKDEG